LQGRSYFLIKTIVALSSVEFRGHADDGSEFDCSEAIPSKIRNAWIPDRCTCLKSRREKLLDDIEVLLREWQAADTESAHQVAFYFTAAYH
jgi:hypothetical protein